MSAIKERLQSTLKQYMKERDVTGVSAVRMMLSAITTKEKERPRPEGLSEEEVVGVISSYHRRLREALEGIKLAGRDTAQVEAEMRVVEAFLPQQLGEEELDRLIVEKIEALQAEGKEPAFGLVMRAVMAEAKGRADGKLISEKVRARLGG